MTEENENIIDKLNQTITELVVLSVDHGVHPLNVARILEAHARAARDCFNIVESENADKKYH